MTVRVSKPSVNLREKITELESNNHLDVRCTSLVVDGDVTINADSVVVASSKTPASASDTGTTGEIAWDSSYIYVCIATDTWVRAAIATW